MITDDPNAIPTMSSSTLAESDESNQSHACACCRETGRLDGSRAEIGSHQDVIVFLVAVLMRIDETRSLDAARAIGKMARDRIAGWRAGSWHPGPHNVPPASWEPARFGPGEREPHASAPSGLMSSAAIAASAKPAKPAGRESGGAVANEASSPASVAQAMLELASTRARAGDLEMALRCIDAWRLLVGK